MEKYGKARQAVDDNVTTHALFMLHTRATDTRSEYIIRTYCLYTATMVYERASLLRVSTLPVLFNYRINFNQ